MLMVCLLFTVVVFSSIRRAFNWFCVLNFVRIPTLLTGWTHDVLVWLAFKTFCTPKWHLYVRLHKIKLFMHAYGHLVACSITVHKEVRAFLSTILKLMIWTLDLSHWPSDKVCLFLLWVSYDLPTVLYSPQGMLCVLYFCIRPIIWYLIVQTLQKSLLCKLISVFKINFSLNVYNAHIYIALDIGSSPLVYCIISSFLIAGIICYACRITRCLESAAIVPNLWFNNRLSQIGSSKCRRSAVACWFSLE